jgi:gliding motility-associated-like protein
LTLTATSACGTATATKTITVNPAPSAPTGAGLINYCENATATPLTATATGTLLWYTVATGGTGSATAPTPSTAATGSTTYYVTQTQTGCESARTPIVVTINPLPTAGATNTGPYCGTAGTITVNASGGTTYNWSGPNGYTGTGASPTPFSAATYGAGTYDVTVSDANNCTATASTTVIVGNPPIPTVTSPVTYCQNATATPLTATAAGSLLWYTVATGGTGSATAPTPSTSAGGSTTYYVSQTIAGCEGARASIVVTVNPSPTVSASNTGPYCGATGTITVSATGGTTYNWSGPNGYSGSGASPVPFSQATYGGGAYNVTVTDANNCTATTSTTVIIGNPPPPTVVTPVTYCQNTTATPLTATAAGNVLWFTAVTGGTGSATAPTPSTTTSGSTTYYLSQTQNGCESARDSIIVTVNPTPVATATNTGPYCTSGTISLAASGGATYNWSGPNAYSSAVASPAPFSAATGAGIYNVTVTTASNCTATASTTVAVSNTITKPVSQTICNGQSITFNGQNLSSAGVYRDTSTSVTGCDSMTVLTLTVISASSTPISQAICSGASYVFKGQSLTTSGTYADTLTNAGGCDSIVVLTLDVEPQPVAGFSLQPAGDSVVLGVNVYAANNSTNASSVTWLLNNQAISLSSGSALPLSDTGLYCIGLIASNTAGCNDTSTTQCIRVYTTPVLPVTFYLPNAFTPNGDGTNDFLELYSNVQQITYMSISLFDRWGEKVFQSYDPGFRWDGTYKGKPCPIGVYAYQLDLLFSNGTSVHNKGAVTLLK